jgi:mycothiol synthase
VVLPPPEVVLPPGVRLRPFTPGRDDAAWLDLNRRAFAGHPEQGRWTQADLAARLAEPWFDPAGFLLAEVGGRLAGFHWTKVHPAAPPGAARRRGPGSAVGPGLGPGPVGEVYVIAVDPAFEGVGLGRGLLAAGLRHLSEQGIPTAMLYVDEDNTRAVRLYTGLGFTPFSHDVSYAR